MFKLTRFSIIRGLHTGSFFSFIQQKVVDIWWRRYRWSLCVLVLALLFPFSITISEASSVAESTSYKLIEYSINSGAQFRPSEGITPLDIGDVVLWLDASDSSSITVSNGTITQWNDKSGNNHHVAQSSEALAPVLSDTAINGHFPVAFDGVDDFLYVNTAVDITDTTMLIVLKLNSIETTGTYETAGVISIQPGNSSSYEGIAYSTTPSSLDKFMSASSYHYSTSLISSVSETLTEPLILLNQNVDNNYDMYRNGTNVIDVNKDPSLKSDFRVLIGNRYFTSAGVTPSTNGYWYGSVAEVIVFSKAITADERAKIQNYLAKKWGLLSEMDSDGDTIADASDSTPVGAATGGYSLVQETLATDFVGKSSGTNNLFHGPYFSSSIYSLTGFNAFSRSTLSLSSQSSGLLNSSIEFLKVIDSSSSTLGTDTSVQDGIGLDWDTTSDISSDADVELWARAFDGLSYGPYFKTAEFKVDNEAPVISNMTFTTPGDALNSGTGSLAGSWSGSDNLGHTFDISYVRLSDGTSFDPSSLSGMALWLDASNIDGSDNSTLSEGDSITTWTDLSGNGNDAVAQSFGNVPSYTSNGIDSKDSISFNDGNNESLKVTSSDLDFGSDDDFTYVIVYQSDTSSFDDSEAAILSNRYNLDGYQLYVKKSNGEAMGFIGDNSNYASSRTNSSQSGDIAHIVISTFDRGNDEHSIYLNGLKKDTVDFSHVGDSSMQNGQALEIGHEFNQRHTSKYFYEGDIAEILIFSKKLTPSDISGINNYLSQKWGLTATVDSDGDGIVDASDTNPTTFDVSASIPGMALWLDASNIDGSNNSTLSNGNTITTWMDLSTLDNHAVQDDVSRKPTKIHSNGMDLVHFENANGTLMVSPVSIDSSVKDELTVFTVVSVDDISYQVGIWGQDDGGWDRLLVFNRDSSVHGPSTGSGVINVPTLGDQKGQGLMIIEAYYDEDETDGSYVNLNGELKVTFTADNNSGSSSLGIGASNAIASYVSDRGLQGDIAEMIIFDRSISNGERYSINYYLSQKWGITDRVDSDSDGALDASDSDANGNDIVDLLEGPSETIVSEGSSDTSLSVSSVPDLTDFKLKLIAKDQAGNETILESAVSQTPDRTAPTINDLDAVNGVEDTNFTVDLASKKADNSDTLLSWSAALYTTAENAVKSAEEIIQNVSISSDDISFVVSPNTNTEPAVGNIYAKDEAWLKLTLTDAAGNSLQKDIEINISAVNDPPVLNPDIGSDVYKDQYGQLVYSFLSNEDTSPSTIQLDSVVTDIDNPLSSLVWTASAPNLLLGTPAGNYESIYEHEFIDFKIGDTSLSHELLVEPQQDWYGDFDVTLKVSDGDASSFDEQDVIVRVWPVNDPPSAPGMPTTFTVDEDTQLVLDLKAYESDSLFEDETPTYDSQLTWTVLDYDTDFVSLKFEDQGADTVTLIPVENKFGSSTLILQLLDTDLSKPKSVFPDYVPAPLATTMSVTVVWDSVNDVPVIADAIADQVVFEDGASWTLALGDLATDLESDDSSLTWSVSASDPTLLDISIDNTTKIATFTPKADKSGNSTLNFDVSDGTDTTQRQVSLSILPQNDIPSLAKVTVKGQSSQRTEVAKSTDVLEVSSTGYTDSGYEDDIRVTDGAEDEYAGGSNAKSYSYLWYINPVPQTPTLALWFDASDLNTLTTDSHHGVVSWKDKSLHGNHASQGLLTSRPTLLKYRHDEAGYRGLGESIQLVDAKLETMDSDAIDLNTLTIEMWVNFDQIPYTNQILLEKYGQYSLCAGDIDDRRLTLRYASDLTSWADGTLVGTTILEPNRWYYIAATYDGQEWALYLDGKKEATRIETGTLATGSNKLTLGQSNHNTDLISFTGKIDELRLWKEARTQEELVEYQYGAPVSSTLVRVWSFDKVTQLGTTIHKDLISNISMEETGTYHIHGENSRTNDKPVVRFDGLDDRLQGVLSESLSDKDMTFIAVIRDDSSHSSQSGIISTSGQAGLYSQAANKFKLAQVDSTPLFEATTAEDVRSFSILSGVYQGTSFATSGKDAGFKIEFEEALIEQGGDESSRLSFVPEYTLFVNGELKRSYKGSGVSLSSGNKFEIGGHTFSSAGVHGTHLNQIFKGEIAEILVFNAALPGTYRKDIEEYLNVKWGLGLPEIAEDIFIARESTTASSVTLNVTDALKGRTVVVEAWPHDGISTGNVVAQQIFVNKPPNLTQPLSPTHGSEMSNESVILKWRPGSDDDASDAVSHRLKVWSVDERLSTPPEIDVTTSNVAYDSGWKFGSYDEANFSDLSLADGHYWWTVFSANTFPGGDYDFKQPNWMRLVSVVDPVGFEPSSLPGVTLWLDGADASTIEKDGSDVITQWRDKSSHANHFIPRQYNQTASVTYDDDGMVSQSSIYFNGYGQLEGTKNRFNGGGDTYALFFVLKPSTGGGVWDNLILTDTSPNSDAIDILFRYNKYSARTSDDNVGWTTIDAPDQAVLDTVSFISLERPTATDFKLYQNGDLLESGTLNSGLTLVDKIPVIGGMYSGNYAYTGQIAEVIFVNRAITDTERATILYYLDDKWGTGFGFAQPGGGGGSDFALSDGLFTLTDGVNEAVTSKNNLIITGTKPANTSIFYKGVDGSSGLETDTEEVALTADTDFNMLIYPSKPIGNLYTKDAQGNVSDDVPIKVSFLIDPPTIQGITQSRVAINSPDNADLQALSDGGTISDMPTVADLTKAALSFSSDRDLASYSLLVGSTTIAEGVSFIQPFDPTTISGQALWLDASNIDGSDNSTLSNGDTISSWTDLSGNGNHATQDSADWKPTYSDSNGLKKLSFNTDRLLISDSDSLDVGNTFTYAFVYKSTSSSSGMLTQKGCLAAAQLWLKTSGIQIDNACEGTGFKNETLDDDINIIFMVKDASAQSVVYVNGQVKADQGGYSALTYSNNTSPLSIGSNANADNPGSWFGGELHELMLFDGVLTDENIVALTDYLSKKWNLTARVDSDGDGTVDASDDNPTVAAFSPNISGLELWLDASNIDGSDNSTLSNGDSISTWTDLSGNGLHASQSNSGKRPALVTDSLNALSTVSFSSDYLTTGIMSLFDNNDDGLTIFTIFKTSSAAGQKFLLNFGTYMNGQNGAGWCENVELGYSTGNTAAGNYGFHIGCSRASVTDAGTIVNNEWVMMASRIKSSGAVPNNVEFRKNGTVITTNQDQTGFFAPGSYPTVSAYLDIGARNDGGGGSMGNYHAGDIAEILVYKKELTDDEISNISLYLSQKWGLADIVDSDGDGIVDSSDTDADGDGVADSTVIADVAFSDGLFTLTDGVYEVVTSKNNFLISGVKPSNTSIFYKGIDGSSGQETDTEEVALTADDAFNMLIYPSKPTGNIYSKDALGNVTAELSIKVSFLIDPPTIQGITQSRVAINSPDNADLQALSDGGTISDMPTVADLTKAALSFSSDRDLASYSLLVGSTTIAEGVSSVPGFDPLSISGLKLWLDASDIDGDNETTDNPSNGSYITTWTDKSGNGNHGVSIASPGQPIYTTGALNSNGVIEFDGINDGMSLGDVTLESDYTIFIINRYSGAVQGRILQSRTLGRNWLMGRWQGTLGMYAAGWVAQIPSIGTVWTLDMGTRSGATNALYSDGALLGSQVDGDFPGQLGLLGSNWTGGTNYEQSNAQVAEIMVFDRPLTDDERADINVYLADKWGLTATVDSDGDGTVDASDADADGGGDPELTPALLADTALSIDILGNNTALSEGANEALLTITDEASNISKHTFLINRDTTAPESTVITLGNASLNTDGTYGISLTGTREPGVGVFVSVTDVGATSTLLTDPSSLSGLALWLDASNIDGSDNSTLSDGDAISAWTDLSGNGYDLTQSTSVKQPLFNTNSINSKPAVTFDGVKNSNGDYLQNSTELGLTNAYTIYVVTNKSSYGGSYRKIFSTGSGSSLGVLLSEGPGSDLLYAYTNIQGDTNSYPGSFISVANSSAVSGTKIFKISRTISESKFFINSNLIGEKNHAANGVTVGDINSNTTTLGYAYGTEYWDGDVGEVLIFDTELSDFNSAKVTAYLSEKWGLTATVDSDGDGIVDASDTNPTTFDVSASIPGMALWLDASNIDGSDNSTLSDGDSISTWTDLSGGGNHVAQATDSKKPTLITNSNKQYLSFDGSNDSLGADFTGHILDDPTGQSVTILTVVKPKIITGDGYILSSGGQTSSARGYALGNSAWSIFKDASGGPYIEFTSSFELNQTHLVTHSFDRSISNYDVLLNGSIETDSASTYGAASNLYHNFTIGMPNNIENYYGEFEIAEVIVISSVDSQKITDIQAYLAAKWGLESTVDSDGDGIVDASDSDADGDGVADSPDIMPVVASEEVGYSGLNFHYTNSSMDLQNNDLQILIRDKAYNQTARLLWNKAWYASNSGNNTISIAGFDGIIYPYDSLPNNIIKLFHKKLTKGKPISTTGLSLRVQSVVFDQDKTDDGLAISPLLAKHTYQIYGRDFANEINIDIDLSDHAIHIGIPIEDDIHIETDRLVAVRYDNETDMWIAPTVPQLLNEDASIMKITIDKTGVWALAEYMPFATTFAEMRLYPNPWVPNDGADDTGDATGITFDNLMTDSQIRIYTITGQLVVNTIASGSSYIWDGKNLSGDAVFSGVYLYMITAGDDSDTKRGKLTIIR